MTTSMPDTQSYKATLHPPADIGSGSWVLKAWIRPDFASQEWTSREGIHDGQPAQAWARATLEAGNVGLFVQGPWAPKNDGGYEVDVAVWPRDAPPRRKLSNAYWLWFFLGGVGGHQFYLGNKGRAVSYIFTGAWLTIGLWIDVFTMRKQLERTNARRSAGQR